MRRVGTLLTVTIAVIGTVLVAVPAPAVAPQARPRAAELARVGTAVADAPLTGRRVVIDPGHQLGNRNYPQRIHRLVPAGGFRKPCNTTGTATNGGFPEAPLAWDVAH